MEHGTFNQMSRVRVSSPYPEELLGGAWVQRPVGDLCLFSQVFCAFYGRHHSLHSEEGSQVGCVGRNDDKGEEPPHAANNTPRQRPGERTVRGRVGVEGCERLIEVKRKGEEISSRRNRRRWGCRWKVWLAHGRETGGKKNREGNIIKVSSSGKSEALCPWQWKWQRHRSNCLPTLKPIQNQQ